MSRVQTDAMMNEMDAGIESAAARLRQVLFAAIYFVEGAVLTYLSAFNVIYLRGFGVSFTRIGLVGGITLIPFVLKLFIGLLSDRVNLFGRGRRKPYIVIGLLLQSVAFVLLGLVSPVDQFPIFLTLMICAALGMSTYDTATDGLSIDATPPENRGLVQGLMVGGRALSGVIAALIIGQLSDAGRWPLVFDLIGGLGLVVLPLALFVREPMLNPQMTRGRKGAWRVFRDGAFLLFLVVGFLYPLALYGANGMVNAFLNEGLGVGLARVGIYTSVFGIGTVLGGIVGGPLIRRVGRRTSIVAALLITFLGTLGLTAVPSSGLAWIVVFVFGIAFGYYETVYFAMGMDFADPRIAAFMFAFIMAVGNIGIGLGQPLAGALVDSLGFRWMFAVFAAVHLLTLPFVYALFRLRRGA